MTYFLATVLSCLFIFDACQDKLVLDIIDLYIERIDGGDSLEFEEIMTLDDNRHAQGGDCWGNYFFQFFKNNYQVKVYDLSIKKLVQTISIPTSERGFVSNCHCNTVCFGTEYFDTEDFFPLIYVSTGYASNSFTGALVYRITQENNRFFITLVQTIKFPVDKSSWTEFVPGDGFAYLCYTAESVIFKFRMPQLKDGDTTLDRNAAFETFQFTPQPDWMSTSRNQDRLFYNGNILYITGVPLSGEASAFVILNLNTQKREKIFDFQKSGLTSESESLFVWQDNICVAFVDRIVKLKI
jgi:hypothetical protein